MKISFLKEIRNNPKSELVEYKTLIQYIIYKLIIINIGIPVIYQICRVDWTNKCSEGWFNNIPNRKRRLEESDLYIKLYIKKRRYSLNE